MSPRRAGRCGNFLSIPQRGKHYAGINYAKCTDNSTSPLIAVRGEPLHLIFLLELVNILASTTFPSVASRIWPRLSSRPTRRSNKKSRGEKRNGHEVTRRKGRKAVHENSELTPLLRLGFLRVNRTHVARNILSWVSTPRELRYRSPSSIVPFPLFSSRKVQQRSNDVALQCNCIKGLSN